MVAEKFGQEPWSQSAKNFGANLWVGLESLSPSSRSSRANAIIVVEELRRKPHRRRRRAFYLVRPRTAIAVVMELRSKHPSASICRHRRRRALEQTLCLLRLDGDAFKRRPRRRNHHPIVMLASLGASECFPAKFRCRPLLVNVNVMLKEKRKKIYFLFLIFNIIFKQ